MKGLCNHSIADLFFFIDLDSGVCYTCAKKKKGGLVLWVGFFVGLVGVFLHHCAALDLWISNKNKILLLEI